MEKDNNTIHSEALDEQHDEIHLEVVVVLEDEWMLTLVIYLNHFLVEGFDEQDDEKQEQNLNEKI